MPSSRRTILGIGTGLAIALLGATHAETGSGALFSRAAAEWRLVGYVSSETGSFRHCALHPTQSAGDSSMRLEIRDDYALSIAFARPTGADPRARTAALRAGDENLGSYTLEAESAGELRLEIPANAAALGFLQSGEPLSIDVSGARVNLHIAAGAGSELLACAELAGSFDPRNDAITKALHPDDRPSSPVRRRLTTLLRFSGFREVRMVPAAEMDREPGAIVWKSRSGQGTAYTESMTERSPDDLLESQRAAFVQGCPEELLLNSTPPARGSGYTLMQNSFGCESTGSLAVATSIVDFIDVVTLAAIGERDLEPFAAANERLLAILSAILPR